MTAIKLGNAVLLNNSIDGVSCGINYNFTTKTNYLRGNINNISLPDMEYNVKKSATNL